MGPEAGAPGARRTPDKVEPVHQLTAQELDDLLGHARLPMNDWARRAIRTAIDNGGITPERAAEIPAELKEPTKPRAP